ncbi:hypothetical protein [[Mycobacterium] nativiensis]|uniref:Uncharacterized protein n=1 Tax=[Mycobacterium] nativiensis TaxID=2855503 RepID=A0ABU5XSC6_9MYCO|nr:hypothetical protein [Mycolicibacter sp. MYC340]MEB3030869.1 hypothetical protein [Mycolicibacter sp. MYC340]
MKDINEGMQRYAETSRQLVNQAGAIALDADHRIKEGSYGSAQWAQSARRLVNLMATAGYELSGALMSQCYAQCVDDVELSEFLEAPAGTGCERMLSVVAPLVAEGSSYAIPPQALVLVPGVLRPFATRFRVGVRGPDYVSGTYRGRIRLTGLPAGAGQVDEMDVIVGL